MLCKFKSYTDTHTHVYRIAVTTNHRIQQSAVTDAVCCNCAVYRGHRVTQLKDCSTSQKVIAIFH